MIVYVNGYYYYKVNVMTNNNIIVSVMIEDLIKYFKETPRANFERLGREGRLKMKKQVISKRICMEAIYLQSMTDFVLKVVQTPNINEAICWEQTEGRLNKIYEYSLFLKQPLQLGFFVPCDENGNVLDPSDVFKSCEKGFLYGKAKERVLFKGFEIEDIGLGLFAIRKNGWILMRCSKSIGAKWENRDAYLNIESLTHFKLELTDSAIKQIGL